MTGVWSKYKLPMLFVAIAALLPLLTALGVRICQYYIYQEFWESIRSCSIYHDVNEHDVEISIMTFIEFAALGIFTLGSVILSLTLLIVSAFVFRRRYFRLP